MRLRAPEEIKRLETELEAAVKTRESASAAATSAAGVPPVDPLADHASSSPPSSNGRSWWKFF